MSSGKVKFQKFDHGYITKRKRQLLLTTLLIIFCGAAVFVTGLLLNKMQTSNIFTIVAVLFSLPMARYLTVFIVVFPYRSTSLEDYNKVCEKVGNNGLVLSDLIFTSKETPMHLDLVVLSGSHAYMYAKEPVGAKEKERLSKTESFLNEHFKAEKFDVKAKLFSDMQTFLNVLNLKEITEEEMEILKKERESMEYFIV